MTASLAVTALRNASRYEHRPARGNQFRSKSTEVGAFPIGAIRAS
jgi:hypothetical protein